jgi:hypothetical protein
MAETHRLWEKIKGGEFDVVISSVDEAEIDDCEELKRNTLKGYLNEIRYTLIKVDTRMLEIASRFVDLGGCDVIVSWNFKHIVNHKTMMGVKAVTALEGFSDLLIYTPSILIGGEHSDS